MMTTPLTEASTPIGSDCFDWPSWLLKEMAAEIKRERSLIRRGEGRARSRQSFRIHSMTCVQSRIHACETLPRKPHSVRYGARDCRRSEISDNRITTRGGKKLRPLQSKANFTRSRADCSGWCECNPKTDAAYYQTNLFPRNPAETHHLPTKSPGAGSGALNHR